jgi:hypothetical protein
MPACYRDESRLARKASDEAGATRENILNMLNMKPKLLCITIVFLMILALGAARAVVASAGGTTVSGDSEARFETHGGVRYMVTRSRTFELTQFAYKGDTVRTAVVEAEITHRHRLSEDLADNGDETGTVTLTVHPVSPSGHFDPPLATRKLAGDEIDIEGSGGVKVTTWGCCAESSAETQLSLNTLKTRWVRSSAVPLLTYTRLGKPAVARVASVYAVLTPLDDELLGKDKSSVAMITWSDDDQPLQRILIRLKADKPREAAMEWTATVGWRVGSAPLDNHTVFDPAKPTKPVFVWQIADGKAIELPLAGDRFDLAAARVPPGVSLKELPR